MPARFEATQYRASPLGNWKVKNMNIKGSIQSIIWLVCRCRGSADMGVVIFCVAHMEAPTSTGSRGRGSGCARSSQRKPLSRGTAAWAASNQEYRTPDRPTMDSGLAGSALMSDQYSAIQMGIWMTRGPRQPSGLTPCSL